MRPKYGLSMSTEIEPFYRDLGQRIQAARVKRGLSQAELGSSLTPPVTRASIANIEGAKQRVLAHTLVELAARLEVAVEDLLPFARPARQLERSESIETELENKLQLSGDQLRALSARLSGRIGGGAR